MKYVIAAVLIAVSTPVLAQNKERTASSLTTLASAYGFVWGAAKSCKFDPPTIQRSAILKSIGEIGGDVPDAARRLDKLAGEESERMGNVCDDSVRRLHKSSLSVFDMTMETLKEAVKDEFGVTLTR